MTISALPNQPFELLRAALESATLAPSSQTAGGFTGSLLTVRSSPKELSASGSTTSEQQNNTLSATKKTGKPPLGGNIQALLNNPAFKAALEG
ncbi:MAG: hypothetical protein K2Q15_17345, partial [Burkholderiales bacterium]|nr:hypothetical protein [Burkholderiales bacterium]